MTIIILVLVGWFGLSIVVASAHHYLKTHDRG